MGQVFALRRMWEMLGNLEEQNVRNQEIGKLQLQELCVLKQGCEDMRMQMEDRVAPVCSDVACACSQALERRGGNRVFALHVRARTI